jgi:hypothetical protein
MRHVCMPSGRASIGARSRRALLVGAGVAAILLGTAPGALATTTIDTTQFWPGNTSSVFYGWGNLNSATWGQVVTVPATDTKLDSFTFYLQLDPSVQFRGEVYAWDDINQHATFGTTALWESSPMSTTCNTATPPCNSSGFQPITFNTGGINLTAGQQYVLFVTTSVDDPANTATCLAQANGDQSLCPVASVGQVGVIAQQPTDTPVYPGGDFVELYNLADTSLWTTVPWNNFASQGIFDSAFQASFSPPQDPTSTSVACSPGTVAVGKPSTCTATVTDTAGSGQTTPTGTVTFGSGGPGSFTGSPCTLAQTSPGVASCQVTYTPGASGTPTRADTITATYSGDSAHMSSSGTTAVTVRPTTKADCKNGGWQNYGFPNQGQCIKFVQQHGG